jgi:hypothetical protein
MDPNICPPANLRSETSAPTKPLLPLKNTPIGGTMLCTLSRVGVGSPLAIEASFISPAAVDCPWKKV